MTERSKMSNVRLSDQRNIMRIRIRKLNRIKKNKISSEIKTRLEFNTKTFVIELNDQSSVFASRISAISYIFQFS